MSYRSCLHRAMLSTLVCASISHGLEPDPRASAVPSFILATGERPEVALTAKPRKEGEYRILEPVAVDVELHNDSKENIRILGYYNPHKRFEIKVTGKKSRNIQHTEFYYKHLKGGAARPAIIRPGHSIRATLYLNLVYDMTCPGKYRAIISVPFATGDGRFDWIAEAEPIEMVISGLPDDADAFQHSDEK